MASTDLGEKKRARENQWMERRWRLNENDLGVSSTVFHLINFWFNYVSLMKLLQLVWDGYPSPFTLHLAFGSEMREMEGREKDNSR